MARILVIDDEEDIRDVLTQILNRAGFQVDVASNGAEGIEQLRKAPTSVVLTDIIMPGNDGVIVIKEIRAEFPEVKIIAMSGGGNFGSDAYKPNAIKTMAYLAAAREAGADLVLSKPFDRQALLEAIRSVAQA